MIHLLVRPATPQQVQEMLEVYPFLINIRPRQGNRSIIIQSDDIRRQVAAITLKLLGGIQ